MSSKFNYIFIEGFAKPSLYINATKTYNMQVVSKQRKPCLRIKASAYKPILTSLINYKSEFDNRSG
ncbi:hypothetical protein BH23BAC3_BH23BAC3_16290 [soil metagenome]